MRHRVVNALANTALLLLFSAIAALILEWGIRWLYPVYSPAGRVEYHCVDGVYRGPENAVLRQYTNTGEYDYPTTFNQYGFRDSQDVALSAPGDIFVVGDSFSYGQGVETAYRYSDVLNQSLTSRVLNISIPNNLDGYHGLLKYAESLGAPIKNIILGVCMENDLEAYSENIKQCVPVKHKSSAAMNLQELKTLLLRHSASYSMLTSVVHQNPVLKKLAVTLGLAYKNEVFQSYMNTFNEAVLQSSAERVKEIASHYRTLVLIIPSRGLWQGEQREEQARIHQHFVDQLKDSGLEVLDLKPAFERDGDPLSFHYGLEGHWNAKGHEAAADEIQRYLKQSALFF